MLSAQAGSTGHRPRSEATGKKKMPLVKHKRREGRIAPTHTDDPTEVVVFCWLVLALFLL